MPDPLVIAYTREGRRFADALRRLLPVILSGTPDKAERARFTLRQMANKMSATLRKESKAWLDTELPAYVAKGQRRAAKDIGVQFGGVNRLLIQRMAQELAPRLATAAESVNPYLTRALRKATALAVLRDDGADQTLKGFNAQVNKSLFRGSVSNDNLKQAKRRLMEDLGLDKGDTVLLMSGRQMQADLYAETVARTRRADAENQAAAYEYETQGFQFIETSSHAGVDPRDICYFLQGKVWALTPNNLGIPLLPPEYGLPPWHPNCVHTFGAWVPELNGGQKAVDKVLRSHAKDESALAAWDGGTQKKSKK